jgi:hypothetical protein
VTLWLVSVLIKTGSSFIEKNPIHNRLTLIFLEVEHQKDILEKSKTHLLKRNKLDSEALVILTFKIS